MSDETINILYVSLGAHVHVFLLDINLGEVCKCSVLIDTAK